MIYKIILSKKAEKDFSQYNKHEQIKVRDKLKILAFNPFIGKRLGQNLKGCFSIRIDLKNRILYEILEEKIIIHILRCKTHYGE